MKLVDASPQAAGLHSAALACTNELFTLSIAAGGLAGLLDLAAGNKQDLTEQQGLALGMLADMAQSIENEIAAIADRLGEAVSDRAD